MLKIADVRGAKLDLATTQVVIVCDKPCDQDILAQMLMGFGVSNIHRHNQAEPILELVQKNVFDVILLDAGSNADDIYNLVRGIRRIVDKNSKQIPIVVICGHLRASKVLKARDTGANVILTKPLSPQVLWDHILWLAKDHRSFIECDTYSGPDRRFKSFGPPANIVGRRRDDLPPEIGEAVEANLSQDAVDGFFSPQKVTL